MTTLLGLDKVQTQYGHGVGMTSAVVSWIHETIKVYFIWVFSYWVTQLCKGLVLSDCLPSRWVQRNQEKYLPREREVSHTPISHRRTWRDGVIKKYLRGKAGLRLSPSQPRAFAMAVMSENPWRGVDLPPHSDNPASSSRGFAKA